MNLSGIDDRLTYYNAKVQLWEHLKERTASARHARNTERDAVTDAQQLETYTRTFRDFFLKSIGGLPETDGPPGMEYCGEISEEDFLIRKLLLEPRPGVKASANLYLPANLTGKVPAILFLCGHSVDAKADDQYQTISRLLVSRGFIVLALDPTGQGERMGYFDAKSGKLRIRPGTGDHEYSGLQCLLQGHNLCRYMLHDAIRAVDFLSTHPLVDASRIGITGSSGGGTQTSLMMLVEPRLAAAAPATFITSRQAIFDCGYGQDAEQIWPGFGGQGYEHVDLLAAFAPKPLCVLSAQFDFFAIEGTRSTVSEARRFWKLFGREENFRAVEDRSVHRYTDALAEAAGDFFERSFGRSPAAGRNRGRPLPVIDLWTTRSGQILGDFPEAKTIYTENLEAFRRTQPQMDKAVGFLREAVFHRRRPVEFNLRITQDFLLGDIMASSGFWWSQPGVCNSGILLRSADGSDVPQAVTIAIWEDGTRELGRHDQWIREEIAGGRAVLVLNVTGMGPLEPHAFNSEEDLRTYRGSFFRICDDLVFLGDSFAALRTYDVLQSLEMLGKWDGLDAEDVRLYLHGPYGIYGALASVLEPGFSSICWESPMLPYAEIFQKQYYNDRDIKSLIIPGLLRYADWPDLMRQSDSRDAGAARQNRPGDQAFVVAKPGMTERR